MGVWRRRWKSEEEGSEGEREFDCRLLEPFDNTSHVVKMKHTAAQVNSRGKWDSKCICK